LKRAPSPPPAKVSGSSAVRTNRGKKPDNNYVNEIEEDEDEEEYLPLSKRAKAAAAAAASTSSKSSKTSSKTPAKITPKTEKPHTVVSNVRPTESTAIGGLAVGTNDAATKPKPKETIVDLTKDDGPTTTGKVAPDSREVTFSKLQGKTFPSLVVVARPSLRVKENANSDRPQLDGKVKNVLMHTATKFTEWLIQQGLVRSDQGCQIHPGTPLKLGMYSDATKFPYSGGYVWISECCPNRFVSVFSGSLFEGSPHPPSVLLKLIYHWACQTTVHNVVQWVSL
jgi:pogo transposable element with ZNF domain